MLNKWLSLVKWWDCNARMVSDACGDLDLVPPGFLLMEEEQSGDVGVMQPSTDSMVKFSPSIL